MFYPFIGKEADDVLMAWKSETMMSGFLIGLKYDRGDKGLNFGEFLSEFGEFLSSCEVNDEGFFGCSPEILHLLGDISEVYEFWVSAPYSRVHKDIREYFRPSSHDLMVFLKKFPMIGVDD